MLSLTEVSPASFCSEQIKTSFITSAYLFFFRILSYLACAVLLWPCGGGSHSPPAVPLSKIYLDHACCHRSGLIRLCLMAPAVLSRQSAMHPLRTFQLQILLQVIQTCKPRKINPGKICRLSVSDF